MTSFSRAATTLETGLFSKIQRMTVGLLIAAVAVPAFAQVTLPRVTAVRTTDGVTVVCRGSACGELLESLGGVKFKSIQLMPEFIPETFLTKAQVCGALRSRSHHAGSCNTSSPPSVPIIDPNWQPNGCGDGSTGARVATVLIGILPPLGGNLNTPLTGVSFVSACNSHNRCYGMGGIKANCDNLFGSNFNRICTASGVAGCSSLAAAYTTGIVTQGQDAYDASLAGRSCAEYARDVNENGCAL